MKKPMPPIYFLGAIVLSVALHFLLPLEQLLSSLWRFAGLVPMALGIALNLLADQAFKKHATTVKPFEKSSALVTGGVFGISRNPMCLGMTLIVLGLAVLLDSATPFAVVAVFAILLDRIFISPEERMLEDTSGDSFQQYRKRVRRWV